MTLGDLLRKYLDDRRKASEERARRIEFPTDYHYYSKEGEDANPSSNKEKKFFSNTLEPKKSKNVKLENGGIVSNESKKSIRSHNRITRLPDGKIQIETVIIDGQGNEEKRITHQEGDKVYTTITRRDASGNEKTEQKVTDANAVTDLGDPVIIFPEKFYGLNENNEDGYNYWFNKFFGSKKPKDEIWRNDVVPFDVNNIDENIARIFRMFEIDPFTGKRRNLTSNEQDTFFDDLQNNDLRSFEDELQKIEYPEKLIEEFLQDTQPKKAKKLDRRNEYNNLNKIDGMSKTSLFNRFAERAITQIPDDKTPFDKFIYPDEEKKQKQVEMYKENTEMMKRLNEYFSNHRYRADQETIAYSSVQPMEYNNEVNVRTVKKPMDSQQLQNQEILDLNDLGKVIEMAFGSPNTFNMRISGSSKIRFPNGNTRTESVTRNKEGNTETTVTYAAGRKHCTITTVSSANGSVLKRQMKHNIPNGEFEEFKQQWDAKYHSDFKD